MRKNYWIVLALVLVLPAMLFTVSCAKKEVMAEPEVAPAEQPMEEMAQPDAEAQAAEKARLEAERLKAEEAERAMAAAQQAFTSEDVYFDFDSSALLPMAQEILSRKADYMLHNPGQKVTIEGNCDERGTAAYNLALGERRADAAKAFLVNLGVNPDDITTISYGEENPVDPGHNEEAWAKNRRDHFEVQ
jgi:peptidoglycan-associated lipoprotein